MCHYLLVEQSHEVGLLLLLWREVEVACAVTRPGGVVLRQSAAYGLVSLLLSWVQNHAIVLFIQ